MIKGIGIDIIEIERVASAIKNKRFLSRVFTERELEYLASRNMNEATAAGLFAAKEAVSKALGTGIGKVHFTDIEILKESSGRPVVRLHREAINVLQEMGGTYTFISISHSKEYAVAQAVIE